MSKQHDVAKRVVDEKIKSGSYFNYKNLCDEIVDEGGILRVSPGTTIGQYLMFNEELGLHPFNFYL